MHFRHRLLAIALIFGGSLAILHGAAADEWRPQLATATLSGADAFPDRGKLNDAELKAVSGQGADPAGKVEPTASGEVSVILFDELGQPKRNTLAPGNGTSSTIVRGVHVQVGR